MEGRLFATRKRRTPSETGSWSVLIGMFPVLDTFQVLFCIRNEAEKSIKIFKIVVSGLPARLEDLYLKWQKTALFRTYQQLREDVLTTNSRPSIGFFRQISKLFVYLRDACLASCFLFHPSIKARPTCLFSRSPVSHSSAPPRPTLQNSPTPADQFRPSGLGFRPSTLTSERR